MSGSTPLTDIATQTSILGTLPPSQGTTIVPSEVLPNVQTEMGENSHITKTQFNFKKKASHVLVIHQPPAQKPTTSGHYSGDEPYSLEFIEPGIQNHKVEV